MKDFSIMLNYLIFYKEMKNILSQISEVYAAFSADAQAQIEKGNKAAGTRARKAALQMVSLLKEFRKASVEASKTKAE